MHRRLAVLIAVAIASTALSGCNHWVAESSRPLIAIDPITVTTPVAPEGLGRALTDLITDELVHSGKFTVLIDPAATQTLDNTNWDGEDSVSLAGRVIAGSLTDARFRVIISVSDCSITTSPGWYPPWQSNRPDVIDALMGMHIQIVNLDTGQVVASERVAGSDSRSSRHHTAAWDSESTAVHLNRDTPLGAAINEAIDRAVDRINENIPPSTWTPMVARVEGERLIVNGGTDRGIKIDDRFTIYLQAREIRDPQTGILLGVSVGSPMGVVRVAEVFPRYAVCAFPEGWQVQPGMVLQPLEIQSPQQPSLVSRLLHRSGN